MSTRYTIRAAEDLIRRYKEKGGQMLQMQEGTLGVGDVLLYDLAGNLTCFVIREVYVNEWTSAQTIRGYNRIPEKYRRMIEQEETA